ncbi:regulatory protein RecX [Marinoscillum sp. MHG1-6]|uniref:regulatory protein RecX n=1 Tax=Marinoscillum sp. MHG1-6 TaxID=2959627 RepID=UPI0021573511|nr:regulatory protein RecX [Marinoscillum sp. MHG1-6]
MNEDRIKRGFASGAKYCSSRERAPKQVRDKLLSWAFSEEEADLIIEKLKEERFLDAERFARAYCHDKFEFNQWGRVKIRMYIGQFDLPTSVVEEALEGINKEKYHHTLSSLAERKWPGIIAKSEDDYLNRRKLADYLMRKGFEGDLVWKVVNEME